MLELENALENIKWDVIGLSEVRRLGDTVEEHSNYILYYKGETKGLYGVGFMVKPELKKNIIEFRGVSERIAILNIKLPGFSNNWSVVQAYAPTESSDEKYKEDFYMKLNETLETCYKNTIVMGDFNGKIGQQNQGEETVVGKYGTGKRSGNGERLISMALEHKLKILNTCFPKKTSKKWTWISPDGLYHNEIDYILSNQPGIFHDVDTVKQLNFNTNHRMVRAVLSGAEQKKCRRNYRKFNCYQPSYKDKKENTENNKNKTQELYNKEMSNMYNSNIMTKLKNKKPEILSMNTIELIQKRKALLMNKRDKTILKEITKISKEISKNIKKDRTKKTMAVINNHITKTGGIKKALKELRDSKTWIPKLKDKMQTPETKRGSILDIATNFYKTLYSSKCLEPLEKTTNDITGSLDDIEENIPPILEIEVSHAVRSQRNDKSPGQDNITNEMMKITLPENLHKLTHLYNVIMESEYIPVQWTSSTIILIYKKGDKDDINNYRPISLMSNMYKVFSKIILNRISKTLEFHQPPEQAGFRAGYSTTDHMHSLKQVIEKSQEFGYILYLAFVDYNKAFDCLEHHHIWRAIENQGVEPKYIRLIKNVYSNSSAAVKLETCCKTFPIRRGVRQGDPLSPKLFSAVLEEVMRKLSWDDLGINIDGRKLNHLRFADNLVLISENPETLQSMLQDLASKSEEVGLTINKLKTKVMANNTEKVILVDNEEIEYVSTYIYLGQIISFQNQMPQEIDRRVTNAWKRYWALKDILKNKIYKMNIKRKLFNTCLLPILTYGCQTWALTQKLQNKLRTAQRSMERSILGYKRKDKMRASDLRKITKFEDVNLKCKLLKWRWTGHMARQPEERWAKTLTEWTPRYKLKRKRGRQLKRWADDLRRTAGTLWIRTARNREEWKKLEEAYVSAGHTDD